MHSVHLLPKPLTSPLSGGEGHLNFTVNTSPVEGKMEGNSARALHSYIIDTPGGQGQAATAPW